MTAVAERPTTSLRGESADFTPALVQAGALVMHPLRRGSNSFCEGECEPTSNGQRRAAFYAADMAGHPAAMLCRSCAKEWEALWRELAA